MPYTAVRRRLVMAMAAAGAQRGTISTSLVAQVFGDQPAARLRESDHNPRVTVGL